VTDDQHVSQRIAHHIHWHNKVRGEHDERRGAFSDKYWNHDPNMGRKTWATSRGGLEDPSPKGRMVKVQVNLIKPFVSSFIASLYYRGVKFSVEADELVTDKKAEDAKDAAGVRALLNRFFALQPTTDAAERLFAMGLLYRGGCALKLGVDAEDDLLDLTATDKVWLEAMPPHECVWDRRARSLRAARYFGRMYSVDVESARKAWPDMPSDEELELHALLDPVGDGLVNQAEVPDRRDATKAYVHIYEEFDLHGEFEASDQKGRGRYTTWLVSPDNPHQEGGPTVVRLHDGPTPATWWDKRPVCDIIPFIPEPFLEFPLDSLAPVDSIYEINSELNHATSVLAEAYRRDAARIVTYLKDHGVDEEVLEQIMAGEDLAFIGVEAETLEGLFRELDLPPVSSTLLEYIKHLHDSADRTQILADLTRGKAGEYLSATEAAELANYSETQVGRIRKRMDDVFAQAACVYLRCLLACMQANKTSSLEFVVDGESHKLTRDAIARRWRVQVIDTASTPLVATQKQAEFIAALPVMRENAVAMGDAAVLGLAREAQNYMVDLHGLPPSFRAESIMQTELPEPEVEELPPPLPEEMPPGPMGEQLPLEDENEMVAQSPGAQAVMAQVEEENI
jgi:hypothetical protein